MERATSMSHSARFMVIILIIAIIDLLACSGYGSDSLKVGLVFQNFNQNQADSLSNQFTKMLSKNAQLKIEIIDSFDLILLEYFELDSITLKQLKQQQFRGLILCKFSTSDNVNKMIIAALDFDNLKRQQIGEVALDRANLSGELLAIAGSMDSFFQIRQQISGTFRVIFLPISPSTSDSSRVIFQQSLVDSLTKISNSPLFAKMELNFIAIDSVDQMDLTDSTLQKLGKSHQAHLIISGRIDKDERQSDIYYPHLIIPKQYNFQTPLYTDDRLLSGKTCQISEVYLPAVSLQNLHSLTDFIKGYLLIQAKKYSDAIEQLKKLQSFPANFHLAASYFYRGMITENDHSMAGADRDSSIFYWQKALSQTDSHWDSVCTNNNLGVAFQLSGQMDSALVYYHKANSDWTGTTNKEDFIHISHNLGNSYLLSGQWKKALDIFQSTLTAMEQSNDSLNLAMTYESLGHIYQLIYQRNKAMSYYQKALELREKMHDEARLANSFSFLGNAYQGNKDYQLAIDYFRKSLALNLKIHHEPQLASAYDNLGLVFQDTGELDSALFYFQKSNETFDMLDDKDGSVQTMLHLASAYQKQKVFDKAIALNEKALDMIGNNNSNSLRAQIYDRLGDIYNHQENLIPALDYYQQAAELYEKASNFEILSLILYNMGLIKLKQNDYAEGYQLLKKAISLDEERGFNNLSGEQDFLQELEGILKKN